MTDSDVFEDDFMPDEAYVPSSATGTGTSATSPAQLLRSLKFWFMRHTAGGSRSLAASMERIGVPLYDLTEDGHEIHDNDNDDTDFHPGHYGLRRGRRRISRRALKLGLGATVLACATVFLLVQILRGGHARAQRQRNSNSHPRFLSDSALDPNARYSNGTVPFYPLTVVLVAPGLGSRTVMDNAGAMPLLAGLVRGETAGGGLLAGSSLLTAGAEGMAPLFPLTHAANAWSMFSGLEPRAHGVLYDSGAGNATRGVLPLWSGVENAFRNFRTAVDSEVLRGTAAETKAYAPAYYLDRQRLNKKKGRRVGDDAMVDWVLGLVDGHGIETRPQLVVASLVEYAETVRGGNSEVAGSALALALALTDQTVTRLLVELRRRSMLPFTNVLVVSDYGFAEEAVRGDHVLDLEDLIPKDTAKLVSSYRVDESLMSVSVSRAHKNEVYGALLHNPHNESLQVELGGSMPDEWKGAMGSTAHPGDILVVPREPGWALVDTATKRSIRTDEKHWYRLGGYPPSPENGALLVGVGPAFARRAVDVADIAAEQEGGVVPTVRRATQTPQNRVVYALVAEMCGLAANDRNSGYLQALPLLFESEEIKEPDQQGTEEEEASEEASEEEAPLQQSQSTENTTPSASSTTLTSADTIATSAPATTSPLADSSETPIPPTSDSPDKEGSPSSSGSSTLDEIIADGVELVDDIIEWLQTGLSDLVDGSGQNQD